MSGIIVAMKLNKKEGGNPLTSPTSNGQVSISIAREVRAD